MATDPPAGKSMASGGKPMQLRSLYAQDLVAAGMV